MLLVTALSPSDKVAAVEVWNSASERFQSIIDVANNETDPKKSQAEPGVTIMFMLLTHNYYLKIAMVAEVKGAHITICY